jgi:hypothetical protein
MGEKRGKESRANKLYDLKNGARIIETKREKERKRHLRRTGYTEEEIRRDPKKGWTREDYEESLISSKNKTFFLLCCLLVFGHIFSGCAPAVERVLVRIIALRLGF